MINQRDTFKKALFEAMSEKYDDELSNIDSEQKIICSKKHYLKLSNILGFNVGNTKKISKRILVGILIAALLLTGCAAYIYRNEIKELFVEIYEKHMRLTYDNDSKTTMDNNVLIPYKADYVPEGYELVKESISPIHASYEWQDSDGNVLILHQQGFDSAGFYFDVEHGADEIIIYEQYKIYCRKYDGAFFCIWNDGDYALSLDSTVEFSQDELLKIIKGFK